MINDDTRLVEIIQTPMEVSTRSRRDFCMCRGTPPCSSLLRPHDMLPSPPGQHQRQHQSQTSCRDLRAFRTSIPPTLFVLSGCQVPALPLSIQTVQVAIFLIHIVPAEFIKGRMHHLQLLFRTLSMVLGLRFTIILEHHKPFRIEDKISVLILQ